MPFLKGCPTCFRIPVDDNVATYTGDLTLDDLPEHLVTKSVEGIYNLAKFNPDFFAACKKAEGVYFYGTKYVKSRTDYLKENDLTEMP